MHYFQYETCCRKLQKYASISRHLKTNNDNQSAREQTNRQTKIINAFQVCFKVLIIELRESILIIFIKLFFLLVCLLSVERHQLSLIACLFLLLFLRTYSFCFFFFYEIMYEKKRRILRLKKINC